MGTKDSSVDETFQNLDYHDETDEEYGKVYDTFSKIAEVIRSGKPVVQHNHGSRDVYILELCRGKYYVGETSDITRSKKNRMQYHAKHVGSRWTQKHPPKDNGLIQVFENVPREFEDEVTVACARLFGQENVRGGRWHDPEVVPPIGY